MSRTGRAGRAGAVLGLGGALWSGPAAAHTLSESVGAFYGGLLHPAISLEHALPLIALGLLGGQNGRPTARRLLLAVPAALALGTALAPALPEPPALVTAINLGSFVLLGLLLALARPLPWPLLVAIGGVLGLTHGVANGGAIALARDVFLFTCGTTVAGLGLVGLPAAAAVALEAPWQRLGLRILGSWLAAAGAMILALAQRGPAG